MALDNLQGIGGENGKRCSFVAWSDKKRVLASLYTEDHYVHGIRLAHGTGVHSPAEVDCRRGLLTHASSELTEWGVVAALHYGVPQGLGSTAEIRPVWEPEHSGGMQAFWRPTLLPVR